MLACDLCVFASQDVRFVFELLGVSCRRLFTGLV